MLILLMYMDAGTLHRFIPDGADLYGYGAVVCPPPSIHCRRNQRRPGRGVVCQYAYG